MNGLWSPGRGLWTARRHVALAGPSPLIDARLKAWWNMDEAGFGTRADAHTGARTLSSWNNVAADTGKSGNAAKFVRSDIAFLYRAVGADSDPFNIPDGKCLTIACFAYPLIRSQGAIVAKLGNGAEWGAGSYYVLTLWDQVPGFWVNGTGMNWAGGDLALTTWHHIVARYDGANMTIRVNGVNSAPTARAGNVGTGTAAFTVGSRGDSIGYTLDARLDGLAVAIGDSVWSDAECDLHEATNGAYPG